MASTSIPPMNDSGEEGGPTRRFVDKPTLHLSHKDPYSTFLHQTPTKNLMITSRSFIIFVTSGSSGGKRE